MAKNIFVGSLPFSTTDDTLGQLFAQYGSVQSVNIIKDKYTGTSRGFAFVEMATDDDARKAIDGLNGYNMDGRAIVVKEALPKPTYTGRDDNNRRGSSRGGFGNNGGGRRDFRR
jgi:RNA recognition motif-containing protein